MPAVLRAEEGSLYPALHRMEEAGWVKAKWITKETGRRARLYELTSMDLYALYQEDVNAYVMVLQNINRELCRRLRRAGNRIAEYADEFGDEATQIRPDVRLPKRS